MTTQPEAARVERGPITKVERFTLGMAALLERQGFTVAANELRRLHAELRRLQIDGDARDVHLSERMKDLFKVEAQRDALLEALKLIVEFVDSPTEGKRPDVFVMRISKARAAIAKAEGKTE